MSVFAILASSASSSRARLASPLTFLATFSAFFCSLAAVCAFFNFFASSISSLLQWVRPSRRIAPGCVVAFFDRVAIRAGGVEGSTELCVMLVGIEKECVAVILC